MSQLAWSPLAKASAASSKTKKKLLDFGEPDFTKPKKRKNVRVLIVLGKSRLAPVTGQKRFVLTTIPRTGSLITAWKKTFTTLRKSWTEISSQLSLPWKTKSENLPSFG